MQSVVTAATVDFWHDRGAVFGHLPITTGSVSSPMGLGSDSMPVRIEIAGEPTYLADSMQFGLELLCRANPDGSYYLMPSFRGEESDETHLAQFYHAEAEVQVDLDGIIGIVDQYFSRLCEALLVECGSELATVVTAGDLGHLEDFADRNARVSRLTFDDAVEELAAVDGAITTSKCGRWRDLTRKGERLLVEQFGPLVWVTHWDSLAVPFYQAVDHKGHALNGDLLVEYGGEVVGAGQRHAAVADLLDALQLHELPAEDYGWYVEMKRRYPLRTSGFGMGVERFLMWATRRNDIREFELLVRRNGETWAP